MLKLKLDANGNAVLKDGKPVYVNEDGKEIDFDANHAFTKIATLNGECKTHRENAESLSAKLKNFEGLDPEAARKAIEVSKNLDDKKLVDAGEVETLKKSIAASYTTKIEELEKGYQRKLTDAQKEIETRDGNIFKLLVTNQFGQSSFVKSKVAIPADMVEAAFGKNFKVEEGRVVGYKPDGSKIFSIRRPGEVADFDEALETMIETYPHKDKILANQQAAGSGAKNGNFSANGGQDLSKLDPVERLKIARQGGK